MIMGWVLGFFEGGCGRMGVIGAGRFEGVEVVIVVVGAIVNVMV